MRLTDRSIRALKPRASQYEQFDNVIPGFGIRVSNRSKTWVLFYRERLPDSSGSFASGKRQRRWTLGTYPAMNLADAQKKAHQALHALNTKGIDPADGKQTARTASTFGDLAADYMERHAKRHKKSWREDRRKLEATVLPRWKSRPVKSLQWKDVRDLIDPIVDRGAPVAANRVLALVSTVFMYGIDKDWLDANPAGRIKKQPEQSRVRVLTDEELVELWTVLESGTAPSSDTPMLISPMVARGLQLQLLTGQRGGEIFTMTWDEVDETTGWWTIPAAKTKNGTTHRVPLTEAALALLPETKARHPNGDGWVFAGRDGGSFQSRAKKAIATLRNAGLLTGHYWRHDLRRTIATSMTTAGIPSSTVNKVLNQQEGGPRVTGIYDRYSYDKEKRQALDTWGRHLDVLIHGKASARVVPFRQ